MEIDLTPEQVDFVRLAVSSGRFAEPAQAVHEAMTLWVERERKRVDPSAGLNPAEASPEMAVGHPLTHQTMAGLTQAVTDCRRYGGVMDGHDILARLRENESALRAQGVLHAALFGSRARGEAREGSDTDILVELDPSLPLTIFDYAGIKLFVADLFEGPVDVVNRAGLKPDVGESAVIDAVYAF